MNGQRVSMPTAGMPRTSVSGVRADEACDRRIGRDPAVGDVAANDHERREHLPQLLMTVFRQVMSADARV